MSVEIVKFGNIPKAVEEGNEKAILELITGVVAQAKALSPVDKGQQRNGYMGRVVDQEIGFNEPGGELAERKISPRPKKGQGYAGNAVLHSIYGEFGTRFMRAQPVLRPAIAIVANGQNAKEAVKKYENESVKKEARNGAKKKTVIK